MSQHDMSHSESMLKCLARAPAMEIGKINKYQFDPICKCHRSSALGVCVGEGGGGRVGGIHTDNNGSGNVSHYGLRFYSRVNVEKRAIPC